MLDKFGIGVDIVKISRFKDKPFLSNKNFYKKIFSDSEIKYCLKYKNYAPHFSGKFAVKESVIKSIPDKISFLDIKTSNSKYGKPTVNLSGNLEGKYSFLASVSHEREYAIAIVTAEDPS